MTAPLDNGDLTAVANNLDMKGLMEQLNDFLNEQIGSGDEQLLTLASDVATPPARGHGRYQLETQGGASTDNCSQVVITNVGSRIMCLRAYNAGHVVTLVHGSGVSGELLMADGANLVLNSTSILVWFYLIGTSWTEFYRTYGNDFPSMREFLRIPHQIGTNVLAPHKRLKVDILSVSTATITADAVVLENASGHQKVFTAISETFNVATTGAGGRVASENSGNEKASDWYHGWLIGKEDGTLDTFLSLAAFPGGADIFALLPSGYTYAAYVTAMYNNVSSSFNDFFQRGNVMHITATGVLTAGAATSITTLSLAAAVPDTATVVIGQVQGIPASAGTQASVTLYPSTPMTNPGRVNFIWSSAGAVANIAQFRFAIDTPQSMRYAVGSGDTADIDILGFEF